MHTRFIPRPALALLGLILFAPLAVASGQQVEPAPSADAEIEGPTTANRRPDLISRIRWEPRSGTHLQASALFRQLRGFPTGLPGDIVRASGWGVNASGRWPSPIWRARDLVLFQVIRGTGIGHYINDLSSAGDEDGVFDQAANTIRPLPAFSGYASYEHWWAARLHSAFTGGVVKISTLDIQPASALQRTYRYSGNVIWSPIPSLELVTEFRTAVRFASEARRARLV